MSASEAVVAFVAERVGAFLNEEAQLPVEAQSRLRSFQTNLSRMQTFLTGVDRTQEEDIKVMTWMADVIRVCYDAEDVLDIFIFRQRRKNSGFIGLVKRKIVSGVISPYKVVKEIKQLEGKMEDLSTRMPTCLRSISENRESTPILEEWEVEDSERWRFHEEPEVVGLKEEINTLRERLLEEPEEPEVVGLKEDIDTMGERLLEEQEEPEVVGLKEDIDTLRKRLLLGEPRRRVISIVGMGGSGKTTLAKKIYHDVAKYFDCCAFIFLSQEYVIKDVLTRIIKCVMITSKEKIENLNEEELGMMLRDHLREKSYLLVIDDIWSEEAWDMLEPVLPDSMNISRVMLTTRIKDVAAHADPSCDPHMMRLLSDDVGWELFVKKIFPGEIPSKAVPLELAAIGRQIFAECGGLPLAISTLAGLLSTKDKTLRAWAEFLDHLMFHSTKSAGRSNLEKIIALSYWDLPSFLKPCFLYFGLFPKDYEISSARLIRLWIAEGFIQQIHYEILDLEDIAEGYLEELVRRSMIQVTSRRSNGSVGKCRIHVLLRELCISEAGKNNFFTIHNDTATSPSSARVRRLAIYHCINGHETRNRSIASVRSILCFPGSKSQLSNLCNTGGKFLLRVLHVHHEEYSREEVGEFLLLRYLEFISCTAERRPSSIGKLIGLQTLKLPYYGTLPNAIWNLEQLRYLNAYRFDIEGDPQLIKLSNLRTLCLKAGRWIEDGLEKLTKLKKLGIFGDLSSYHGKLSDSILKLHNLRSIKLRLGSSIPPFKPFTSHLHLYKMFLEGKIKKLIEFPPNLTELTLSKSGLEQAAISALEKHQHLKILKLWSKAYRSEKMICSSGGFPRLHLLVLYELPLEEWIVEEGAMSSLKGLELIHMSHLKTLPKQIRHLLKWN